MSLAIRFYSPTSKTLYANGRSYSVSAGATVDVPFPDALAIQSDQATVSDDHRRHCRPAKQRRTRFRRPAAAARDVRYDPRQTDLSGAQQQPDELGRYKRLFGLMADPNDWVILVCPAGAQDGKISHGDRCFEPYREDIEDPHSRWLVRVPRYVSFHLCRVGGFFPLEAG